MRSIVYASLLLVHFDPHFYSGCWMVIPNATCKPKIWKRYVDDIYTASDRDHVNGFLQHKNSLQPTIRFTMKIAKDNTIPFLDTAVTRDSGGLLTITVYRKPTHTDQYLAYDSNNPQSVKRGIVKCLCDRARNISQLVINHKLSLRKRNTCHQYLFIMVILLHLYENS